MDVPASGVAGTIFALLQPVGPEGLGRSALLRRQIIQELQGRVPNSGESTGRGASTGVNGELDQGEIASLPQMAVDGLKDARPPDFCGLGILVAFVSPGTNDVGKIGNANAVREDLLARGLQAAWLVSIANFPFMFSGLGPDMQGMITWMAACLMGFPTEWVSYCRILAGLPGREKT